MRTSVTNALLSLLLGLCASAAMAQDFEIEDEQEEAIASSHWEFFGDIALRAEDTSDLPDGREFERLRSRTRLGLRWFGDGGIELGVAAKIGLGSDDNSTNRINNDNERSDGAGLDELYFRWRPNDDLALTLGKTGMPLSLTPLTWDTDLRPAGVALDYHRPVRDFDAFIARGGWFRGQHMYGDDSQILAAQLGYRWREGGQSGAEVLFSYLDFSDLEQLTLQGLARTNRRMGNQLVSDYELVDLQMAGHVELAGKPLEARLDLVHNLGADEFSDGARFSLVWGDAQRIPGWEVGYSIQRIQRDAVMAAFNSDDWWFHSNARGYMPWVGYGINDHLSVRLMGFFEVRDGLDSTVDRYLLDFRAQW